MIAKNVGLEELRRLSAFYKYNILFSDKIFKQLNQIDTKIKKLL